MKYNDALLVLQNVDGLSDAERDRLAAWASGYQREGPRDLQSLRTLGILIRDIKRASAGNFEITHDALPRGVSPARG